MRSQLPLQNPLPSLLLEGPKQAWIALFSPQETHRIEAPRLSGLDNCLEIIPSDGKWGLCRLAFHCQHG